MHWSPAALSSGLGCVQPCVRELHRAGCGARPKLPPEQPTVLWKGHPFSRPQHQPRGRETYADTASAARVVEKELESQYCRSST